MDESRLRGERRAAALASGWWWWSYKLSIILKTIPMNSDDDIHESWYLIILYLARKWWYNKVGGLMVMSIHSVVFIAYQQPSPFITRKPRTRRSTQPQHHQTPHSSRVWTVRLTTVYYGIVNFIIDNWTLWDFVFLFYLGKERDQNVTPRYISLPR